MLQYKIEALDYKDFKVLAIALEDAAPSSKRSIGLLPADNNNNGNAGPSSLANVSVDPEFTCLLQEASAQFDQAILDLLDTVFQ